jgi:DNA-binding TFAR19-related protein (PDSD5 family)
MDDQERFQLEIAKKSLLMQILDKGAFERLGRVRIANPALAEQVELYLIQANQSGQIGYITEQMLKEILNMLVTKRETKIMRR